MKIDHIAIWVRDLEKMKAFYMAWFCATAGPVYHNPARKFTSYFLTFESGARLELMHQEDISISNINDVPAFGFAHLAISAGSKEMVDNLTKEFRNTGIEVVGLPRTTGDGYYESVIRDPEGNMIEITI